MSVLKVVDIVVIIACSLNVYQALINILITEFSSFCVTSKVARTLSENFITVGLPLEEMEQELIIIVTASN